MMVVTKEKLRTQCLAKRQALPAMQRQISGRAVVAHTLTLIPRNTMVAGYCAIRGEVDISLLMKVLADRRQTLCLPVVLESPSLKGRGNLIFRAWQPGEALVKGAHGTQHPPESAPAMVPDIVLAPLVAFDKAGHRLGYGAGYYDRAIHALRQKNKALRVIGIAFSCQQVERIPPQTHDERLDMIVTENGVMPFSGKGKK